MAGVLRRLFRPQKKALHHKAMELEAAREILAEVFRVKLSEVDEMIESRFEAASSEGIVSKEEGLWPVEFWLE
jgi:CRISPR/Cas system-associated endonuclease Cas3-HD